MIRARAATTRFLKEIAQINCRQKNRYRLTSKVDLIYESCGSPHCGAGSSHTSQNHGGIFYIHQGVDDSRTIPSPNKNSLFVALEDRNPSFPPSFPKIYLLES